MANFAACKDCGAELAPADVIKLNHDNKSNIVTLFLRCWRCQRRLKVFMDAAKWERAHHISYVKRQSAKTRLQAAAAWLADISGVEYLQEIWSKHPPILEDRIGKCRCKECRGRLYVE